MYGLKDLVFKTENGEVSVEWSDERIEKDKPFNIDVCCRKMETHKLKDRVINYITSKRDCLWSDGDYEEPSTIFYVSEKLDVLFNHKNLDDMINYMKHNSYMYEINIEDNLI